MKTFGTGRRAGVSCAGTDVCVAASLRAAPLVTRVLRRAGTARPRVHKHGCGHTPARSGLGCGDSLGAWGRPRRLVAPGPFMSLCSPSPCASPANRLACSVWVRVSLTPPPRRHGPRLWLPESCSAWASGENARWHAGKPRTPAWSRSRAGGQPHPAPPRRCAGRPCPARRPWPRRGVLDAVDDTRVEVLPPGESRTTAGESP
jgi:hypothetical protein